MKCTRALAGLGMMALGLGIGGAVVAMPGIAAADSSFDWLSTVDSFLSGGALSAADTTPALNLAMSFDGMTLFQAGTAQAYSGGNGDIAIANGAGSSAYAFGSGSYATVDGTDSSAVAGNYSEALAGSSSNNVAFVFGDDSNSFAGGTVADPGSSDYSVIFGNGDTALTGGLPGVGGGNNDVAYVEGNDQSPAVARGADDLFALSKFYGDGPTTSSAAAATDLLGSDPSGALADGNAFWADLFSGDMSGALASGQDFWADLATSFDATGAAADASNFWTELAALF